MKQLIKNYSFSAELQQITLTDFAAVALNRLQLIVDTTTNQILYNFADDSISLATINANVITLAALPAGVADGDALQIIYDAATGDPVYDNTIKESGGNLAALVAAIIPSLTVDTENNSFKDDFPGTTLNAANWNVTQAPGTTTSYSVANSQLSIDADVTPNDYIAVTSVQGFKLPFRAQFIISLSQRIANNNFYLELVNAAGTVVANLGNIATAAGATGATGVTQVAYALTGTTVTTGAAVAQNQGYKATADTNTTIITTANMAALEMSVTSDSVGYGTRTVDSTGVLGNALFRSRTILDPSETYYLQIRSVNGGSAPASPTTLNVEMVFLRDTTAAVVEVFGGQGESAALRGISISALPTLSTVSTVSTVTNGNSGFPGQIADLASAAITSTATTTAVTPTYGTSFKFNIPVTAVAGTNPTMDIEIQESCDAGTNYKTIWQMQQITATGFYDSPVFIAVGNRYRLVQTIGGTGGPSFTRSINRIQVSSDGGFMRQIVDNVARSTINVNSLNSTSATLRTENMTSNIQLIVNLGAITTTAPIFQIQSSDDGGKTWQNVGSTLTGVASSVVALVVNNVTADRFQVLVQTAGSGATKNSVLLKAF